MLLSLALIWPVALNQSKISVVFLLVVFLVLFGRDAWQRPGRFAVGLSAAGFVFMVMLAGYVAHAPGGVSTWRELIQYTYQSNIESSENYAGQLSRGGAVKYWIQKHGVSDIPGTLIGHGVGTARIAEGVTGAEGETVDPSLKIGRLSALAVLWDFGVLGLIFALGMYLSTFIAAGRLARHFSYDPWRAGLMRGMQAAVAITMVSFVNKRFFVFHVGYQTFLMFVFGYLAYWTNRVAGEGRDSSALRESPQQDRD